MDIKELEKAGEIRQQIEELEKFINHKPLPLERKSILRQDPKFRLSIKDRTFFLRQRCLLHLKFYQMRLRLL